MKPLLEISRVSLIYQGQDRHVLKNVDLAVHAEEMAALLGESGCDKSSLLSVAGGLLRPSSGKARFKGELVSTTPTGISVVFQDACLLPWLNVAANQGFGLGFKRSAVPAPERRQRVAEALQEAGLADASEVPRPTVRRHGPKDGLGQDPGPALRALTAQRALFRP